MHENNRRWLTDLRSTHPAFFHRARVLEIGSRIWGTPSDTIRPFFTECDYIGIDKMDGPGVDIRVDDVGHLPLDFPWVDTLAIFSVFEHDPNWRQTLRLSVEMILRPGGLLVTCFGAEGNQHHAPEPWAPVPHAEFLKHGVAIGLVIMDAFFEEERYGRNCAGCYNVVAGKPLATGVVDDVV